MFKVNTRTCYNDLINSFTRKIEKFSQIELILKRLKEAKHHLSEELSQTASCLKLILYFESLEDGETNKIEFLIDQLHLLSKQDQGQHYDAVWWKLRYLFIFVIEIVIKH